MPLVSYIKVSIGYGPVKFGRVAGVGLSSTIHSSRTISNTRLEIKDAVTRRTNDKSPDVLCSVVTMCFAHTGFIIYGVISMAMLISS